MKLYHSSIGFPKGLKIPVYDNLVLGYTEHARIKAEYKNIILPETISFIESQVFEIEIVKGIITKFAVRIHYNSKFDLCMVILNVPHIKYNNYTVKTVWLNSKSDSHNTLDISKYDKPS